MEIRLNEVCDKKEQPIFWIKQQPEHSTKMKRFIQLLDKKQEEEFCYTTTKRRREHICQLASQPQETLFTSLAQGLPLNYFDPIFFNNLQQFLCKKIAIHSIALLPDTEKSFTGCPDELLSDSVFNAKYGKGVLAQYQLDDLDGNIDEKEILSDSEVVDEEDELDDIEMENDLETNQIAFAEDMEDL